MIGGQQNVLAHPEQRAPFAILYVIEYLCHVNITDLLCLECCAFAALLSINVRLKMNNNMQC